MLNEMMQICDVMEAKLVSCGSSRTFALSGTLSGFPAPANAAPSTSQTRAPSLGQPRLSQGPAKKPRVDSDKRCDHQVPLPPDTTQPHFGPDSWCGRTRGSKSWTPSSFDRPKAAQHPLLAPPRLP